jgi:hypothetical protein
VGWYASGLMPIAGVLIGAAIICATTALDIALEAGWLWHTTMQVAAVLLPPLAAALVMYPTMVFLRALGRGWARSFLMAGACVLVQVAVWLGVGVTMFWIMGYVGVVGWSLMQ